MPGPADLDADMAARHGSHEHCSASQKAGKPQSPAVSPLFIATKSRARS